MSPVTNQIFDIITRVTGIPKSHLNPGFDLIDSGVVDSIQLLQLVDAFEKSFGVSIELDEFAEHTTIDKILHAITLRMIAQS